MDRRADLISVLAERHRITCWEVWQMARLVCFGPEAVDNPVFDPAEELELRARRDRNRLKERPSIPELLAIWQRSHDVYLAVCERQRDPIKRAEMFAKLAEREAEMATLRERLGQVMPEALHAEPINEISEQGRLAMQRFRGFVQARHRAGGAN